VKEVGESSKHRKRLKGWLAGSLLIWYLICCGQHTAKRHIRVYGRAHQWSLNREHECRKRWGINEELGRMRENRFVGFGEISASR